MFLYVLKVYTSRQVSEYPFLSLFDSGCSSNLRSGDEKNISLFILITNLSSVQVKGIDDCILFR